MASSRRRVPRRPTARRQHLPLCVGRKGEEVLVAEAPSDRCGGARRGGRRLPVACRRVPEHVGNQRVAALDAIPLALEEPLRAPEPARGRPHLAAQHVVDADPARTVRGTASVSSLDVPLMGPLEPGHPLVVPAEHVGGCRQQLDVRSIQRRLPVGP